MIRLTALLIAGLVAFSTPPEPAFAKNNKSGGGHCPPGLAKKNPPCIPPGQVKRGDWVGNYPHEGLDPSKYRLDSRYGWYKLGDNLYVKTDRETGEIIELFNAISAVLN